MDFKTQWKQLASQRKAKYFDHAAYMIIKALRSKSNDKLEVAKALLLRAYTPITNTTKLANGQVKWNGMLGSIQFAAYSTMFQALDEAEREQFMQLVNQLRKTEWIDPIFAYIITRSDIPPVHRLVQTAHCTMVLGQKTSCPSANTLHFCVLSAADEAQLTALGSELAAASIKHVGFQEPDAAKLWGGAARRAELTSLALYPMRKSAASRIKALQDLKLMEIQ